MKRNKYHIIQTWLLLLCFAAGQYMVYAHTHGNSVAVNKLAYHQQTQPKQTVSDKCQLCDAMHHNNMATGSQAYFNHVVVTSYFYKTFHHDLVSVKLIQSAGRSPPTV